MDLAVDMPRLQVLIVILRHQVATVGGGIDEHVVRHGRHRAIEHALQGLVGILALLEGQIIAKQDEVLGPRSDQVDDLGQVDEITLVDLDDAQALVGKFVEQGLDQRRLARPRAPVSNTLFACRPARN